MFRNPQRADRMLLRESAISLLAKHGCQCSLQAGDQRLELSGPPGDVCPRPKIRLETLVQISRPNESPRRAEVEFVRSALPSAGGTQMPDPKPSSAPGWAFQTKADSCRRRRRRESPV